MFTPHDWRNGVNYSDETYEKYHRVFEAQGELGKLLKMLFIVIACSLAAGLAIWQWENILKLFDCIWNFIISHQKLKEIIILAVISMIVTSLPHLRK